MYYTDKIDILKDIFGTSVELKPEYLKVNEYIYPIIDDVIILLSPSQYPQSLKLRLGTLNKETAIPLSGFDKDIQLTFGEEWKKFSKILPEHEQEFTQIFDLIDISELEGRRVCDLGCGMGRWSYFIKDKCRELILIDFSEAIFVARQNLSNANNAIFFMGDVKQLPFRNDFVDFLLCIGVLHHLPTNALKEVRNLKKYATKLLIYLYYALDNRPFYFKFLLSIVTPLRLLLSRICNTSFRSVFTWVGTFCMYLPFIMLGMLLKPIGLSSRVPLYEVYKGKSLERIYQDVYDRFFTKIEQRFSKKEILTLKDTFSEVIISDHLPYWHFMCEK